MAVEGWAEASELGIIELAKKFEGAGVAAIIYTDIDRDGILDRHHLGIDTRSWRTLFPSRSSHLVDSPRSKTSSAMLQPDARKLGRRHLRPSPL